MYTFESAEVPNIDGTSTGANNDLIIRPGEGECGECGRVIVIVPCRKDRDGFGGENVVEDEIVLLVSHRKIILETLRKSPAKHLLPHCLVVV